MADQQDAQGWIDTPRSSTSAPTRPRRDGLSAALRIYKALREDILALRRTPGEPIVERTLQQAFGVSRTPVREAILRLADEGLIDIRPQAGTSVSRIPLASLPESILIRKALEQATARYAAERATEGAITRLRASIREQAGAEAAGDQAGFHAADEAFHAAIADAGRCPGFWTVVQQVKVQVDRYRLLTLPMPGRMAIVTGQHADIVDAIATHDPDAAAAAMGHHMDYLLDYIVSARATNPRYFDVVES
ncbi:GntR family transcriptional regulator [Marinivivus vitaminiproducens]|uniref:GntR family transcriptional regulator n=1 Tax=Marinivivus vitaminiproducens TaxID=3035935 RepID=UPI00279B2160|nr:GntR family transcriptional regulator [Geminicoccaceae bacterium SCSIO 64248]